MRQWGKNWKDPGCWIGGAGSRGTSLGCWWDVGVDVGDADSGGLGPAGSWGHWAERLADPASPTVLQGHKDGDEAMPKPGGHGGRGADPDPLLR